MTITEINAERRAELELEIEQDGPYVVAKRYGVNHYYTSMMKKDPNYYPRSIEVAKLLGFQVYRVSVPGSGPHGAIRKKYNRLIIHRGTMKIRGVAWMKDQLKEITGVDWYPSEEELDY